MAETKQIIHILNTHFPTNWSNENLRERVIEFGEDVWRQATSDLLEALKAVVDAIPTNADTCCVCQSDLNKHDEGCVIPIVQDAIAKAEGK